MAQRKRVEGSLEVQQTKEDRKTFIRDMASTMMLTLISANGKVVPDYAPIVIKAATEMADSLGLK